MHGPKTPQARFLLRASAFLIAALLVWAWLLITPLVAALREAVDLTIHVLPGGSGMAPVTADVDGNWMIQAPAPSWLAKQGGTQKAFGAAEGQQVKVRSIRLSVSHDVPALFVLVFPVFWAVALAAPWSKRSWRVLLVGTGLLFIEAWLAVLLYGVAKIQDTLHLMSGTGATVLDFLEYMNMYVAPYLAPILIALALNRELLMRILAAGTADEVAVPAVSEEAPSKGGRRRSRR